MIRDRGSLPRSAVALRTDVTGSSPERRSLAPGIPITRHEL